MGTGKRVLDLAVKATNLWDAFAPATDAASTFENAMDRASKAIQGDPFVSDNEDINKIRAIGRVWNDRLAPHAKKDLNFWVSWSGMNAFSPQQTTEALKKLLALQKELRALRDACVGLHGLVVTLNVSDHMNIKEAIFSFATSMKMADIKGRKEALQEIARCKDSIEAILPSVDKATKAVADFENDLHQFLMLKDAADKRGVTEAIRGSKSL